MKKLRSLVWLVTARCNLSCTHCYAQRFRGQRELDSGEALALLIEAAGLGVGWLGLAGGEPLMRPDIRQIIEKSQALGMSVGIVTNGDPVTEEMARFISEHQVSISVSLDGARPETHDRRRGRGSFERAIGAICRLREAGASYKPAMALGQDNHAEVEDYVELARRSGARAACIIPVMPSGRAGIDNVLTPVQMSEALVRAARKADSVGIELQPWCTPFAPLVVPSLEGSAGSCRSSHSMDIDPGGNALLCDVLDIAISSVRDGGLASAWKKHCESDTVQRLEDPYLPQVCATCRLARRCRGGCFARAYLVSGDLYAPDPLCPRVAGIL